MCLRRLFCYVGWHDWSAAFLWPKPFKCQLRKMCWLCQKYKILDPHCDCGSYRVPGSNSAYNDWRWTNRNPW